METYAAFVRQNPLLTAFIQFGILGTIGEMISFPIKGRSLKYMGGPVEILLKIIAWGILGIVIKFGFAGMKGFTGTLMHLNYIPYFKPETLGWALSVSVFTNIFFGPQMMVFHRSEENLIMRQWSFKGIKQAWFTLIWFWIPAHTLTFMLPGEYQIGLAALWSVVLGIILGFTYKSK